ncbi:MAG: sigma-70 family RNA polymerase sigma factor [Planctomycetes bacterium]|nr:sigma-70 family RNA polymerase sigma factor [Planctomycetota bacterium]
MRGRDLTSLGGGDLRFPSTLWSRVVSARDDEEEARRRAMEDLILRYWKPAYAYVRFEWGRDNEAAKDLTQSFFAAFLEKEFLKQVAPEKGRFRSFLKTALANFLRKARRDERRLKRGGGALRIPWEEVGDVRDPGPDPARTAEEAFDRVWRSEIVARGIRELQELLEAGGRRVQWEVFEALVLDETEPSPTREQVAARLGLRLPQLDHHLHAARDQLRRLLKGILVEGLADPRDLDDEWSAVLGTETGR